MVGGGAGEVVELAVGVVSLGSVWPSAGNLAWNLGPIRFGLGLVGGGCEDIPSSTSAGTSLARLEGVASSHLWILSSLPCPIVRLVRGRGTACAAGVCVVVFRRRSLSGALLCWGHVCHGIPQVHCQSRTNKLFWHWLHHMRLSRLWWWKAGFVPGSLCGHRGHRR